MKTKIIRFPAIWLNRINLAKSLILIAVIQCNVVNAQEENQIIKEHLNIQPPSPEAAALGKYVDFPTVASSGVPSISIPLYELRSGRLKVPITLSYHASGIRVGQQSTWAGLGWSLNAGGVIVREVKDIPDDYKMRDWNLYMSSQNKGSIGWLFDVSGRVRVNNSTFPFISEDPFDYQWCSCAGTEKEQIIDLCQKLNGAFRGIDYASKCPGMDNCIIGYPFYYDEYSCDEYDTYYIDCNNIPSVGNCTPYVVFSSASIINNTVGGFIDASNKYDSEPDVFKVNAAGLSFKFVFDKDGNPKVINSSKNIKIKPVFTEIDDGKYICYDVNFNEIKLLDSYLSGFIITDDDGTIYSFDKMEITTTSTTKDLFQLDGYADCDLEIVPSQYSNHQEVVDKSAVSTAWYLSKIENQFGDEIVFTYNNNPDAEESYFQSVTEYENLYYSGISNAYNFLIDNDTKSINISIDKYWLSKISGKDVSIDINTFSSDNEKTNGQYLDNIVINNGSKRIKKYDFTINPVTSPNVNYLSPEDGQAYYRYYLDKIQEYGETDASVKPAYTFSYHYRNLMPNKFSKEQDYWGYYNDNMNDIEPDGGSLIPKLYVYPEQSGENRYNCWALSGMGTEVVLDGANRSVNADRCYSGTLSQITYPTGGKTTYAYEPNTFYDENAVTKTQYGPGIRIKSIKKYDADNTLVLQKIYSYNKENDASNSSGVLVRKPIFANPKTYYSNNPIGVILQAESSSCDIPRAYEHCPMNSDLTNYPVPVSTSVYANGLGRYYTSDDILDYWTKYTERSSSSYSSTAELDGLSLSYTNVVEDNMGNGEIHYAYYSPMSFKNPNVSPNVETSDFAWTFTPNPSDIPLNYIVAPKPEDLQIWGPIEKTGRNIFPHPQFTETDHNLFTKPISVTIYDEDGNLVSINTNAYSTFEKSETSKVYGFVHRKHNTFNTHVISENDANFDPITGNEMFKYKPLFYNHFNDVPYAYARYAYNIGRETLPNKKFSANNLTMVAENNFNGTSLGTINYNSSFTVSLNNSTALKLNSNSSVTISGLSAGDYFVMFDANLEPGHTLLINGVAVQDNAFKDEGIYRGAHAFVQLASSGNITLTATNDEIIDNIKVYSCIHEETVFTYNSSLFLQSETTTANSDGEFLTTNYKYPLDYAPILMPEEPSVYHDESIMYTLWKRNMINMPIETVSKKNGKIVGGTIIKYDVFPYVDNYVDITENHLILPTAGYQIETTTPIDEANFTNSKVIYQSSFTMDGSYIQKMSFDEYDNNGNILQHHEVNGGNMSYFWGYNNTIPIIEAKNISYANLETAVDIALSEMPTRDYIGIVDLETFLGEIEKVDSPTEIELLEHFYDKLKSELDDVVSGIYSFKIYTYDPLIGTTSVTDENGIKTFYRYDGFGRLKEILDNDGNIINSYEYNYAQ